MVAVIAFVPGAMLGGAWYALLTGRKVASKMILKACTKYEVDLTRLERLAAAYPQRVRTAAREANSQVLPLSNI